MFVFVILFSSLGLAWLVYSASNSSTEIINVLGKTMIDMLRLMREQDHRIKALEDKVNKDA